MTASAHSAFDATEPKIEPTLKAPAPDMAGFSSQRPPASDKVSGDDETVTPEQKAAAQTEPRERSKLGADFDGTEFMRLLAMLYGINEIPAAIKPQLDGFKLDATKAKPENDSGTLYATLDGVDIEITKNSVMANGPLTPAMAYKMAAAASLNPSYQSLTLSGTLEDRTMLFLAAKHFKLRIDQDSIPQIPEDQRESLIGKFRAFEKEAQLPVSVTEKYFKSTSAAQNEQRPAERQEPKWNPALNPAMAMA